jgi:hypothetical protein
MVSANWIGAIRTPFAIEDLIGLLVFAAKLLQNHRPGFLWFQPKPQTAARNSSFGTFRRF